MGDTKKKTVPYITKLKNENEELKAQLSKLQKQLDGIATAKVPSATNGGVDENFIKRYEVMSNDFFALKENYNKLKDKIYTSNMLGTNFVDTYDYTLTNNMEETKPLIRDSIEMSPPHQKSMELGNSTMFNLPDEIIQAQRETKGVEASSD